MSRGIIPGLARFEDKRAAASVPICPFYHDLTHAPTALYQCDFSLVDSSGNGRETLGVADSKFWHAGLCDNARSVRAAGGGGFRGTVGVPSLWAQITGAITFECLLWLVQIPRTVLGFTQMGIFRCSGDPATGLAANNALWKMSILAGGRVQYYAEMGAGVPITFASVTSVVTGRWMHLCITRSAGQVVNIYINGVLDATSGVLATPDGGASGYFLLAGEFGGGANSLANNGVSCSYKVIAAELTAAQVAAEATRTLGFLNWAP
jgi:hypothetical protein